MRRVWFARKRSRNRIARYPTVPEETDPVAYGACDGLRAFEGGKVAAVIYLNQTCPRYPVG